MVEPGGGDVADQRQPGGARRRLGREPAVLLGTGERSDAAEQVELEGGYADIAREAGAGAARGGGAGAAAMRCGRARAGIQPGEPVGALDAILRARRGDVGGGDAQVAIIGQRLPDQLLEARILEDVLPGDARQRRFVGLEIGVSHRPAGRHRGFGPGIFRFHRAAGERRAEEQGQNRALHACASRLRARRSRSALSASRTPRRTSTKNSGM